MADSNALTCKELVEIITDYLEGKLSPADVARFEAHLLGCVGCRRYVLQMRLTIQMTGKLTEETLTDPIRSQLLAVFRGWKQGNRDNHDKT